MLRDQGLFSQVISWDSRYTDFYSLRGAQEEWCTAPLLPSKSFQRVWSPRNKTRFFQEIWFQNKIIEKITDTIKDSFLIWARRWNNAVTSYLFSHRVRTHQVNLMMIIRVHSPMDDKLHQLHKDKSIFNAHWGDTINAPVKAKMRKFSRITKYSSKNSITVNKNS